MNGHRFPDSPDSDSLQQQQTRNKKWVETTLSACDCQWYGYLCNDHMELYYDILKAGEDWGYISKGWGDPGFRLGNCIAVPSKNLKSARRQASDLMRFCAVRGLALTAGNHTAESLEFHLESVIYAEGFNERVLAQALDCLRECSLEIRRRLNGACGLPA